MPGGGTAGQWGEEAGAEEEGTGGMSNSSNPRVEITLSLPVSDVRAYLRSGIIPNDVINEVARRLDRLTDQEKAWIEEQRRAQLER